MTIQQLKDEFIMNLGTIYDRGEAEAITRFVISCLREEVHGFGKTADEMALSGEMQKHFLSLLPRLLNHEPVQYVMNCVWFCDLKLNVSPAVLIPRPETEELVYRINSSTEKKNCRILDIGTGSGCIAIALKKLMPHATVTGIDVSEEALDLARKNAQRLRLAVNFHHMNILDYSLSSDFVKTYEPFDIIVSNPPYIPSEEKETMHRSVVHFEPHEALFVKDDALLFYRVISDFAATFLTKGGKMYFEVHKQRMEKVVDLFREKGFNHVKGSKDMSGNDRFVEVSN
jgi:release factor glutamine methyltransferase